jgi:hypothetical protein
LKFNPNKRITAEECLRNKIFDTIRVPELEKPAPFKIKLDIDDISAYDYDNNIDMVYKTEK